LLLYLFVKRELGEGEEVMDEAGYVVEVVVVDIIKIRQARTRNWQGTESFGLKRLLKNYSSRGIKARIETENQWMNVYNEE
jgi:hypothetical protein